MAPASGPLPAQAAPMTRALRVFGDRRVRVLVGLLLAAVHAGGVALGGAAVRFVLPWLLRRLNRRRPALRQGCAVKPLGKFVGAPAAEASPVSSVSSTAKTACADSPENQKEQSGGRVVVRVVGDVDLGDFCEEAEAEGCRLVSPAVRLLTPMQPLSSPMNSFSWQAERSNPMSVMREAIVLVMVGLPARGKSFISSSLLRHLRLADVSARTFNAGSLRRDTGAAGGAGARADYFAAGNTQAKEERENLAMRCCDQMLEWIYNQPSESSCVAILDATNTTRERRRRVLERCREAADEQHCDGSPPPLRVVFIESICDDPAILEGNYKMKLQNDDYKDSDNKEKALEDFKQRVSAYVEQYHPIEDAEVAQEETDIATGLVRVFNGGEKIHSVRTGCSLVMLNISNFLHCFHLSPRKIFLVPEFAADAQGLAALLRQAEVEDEEGRPVDLICRASKHAVRLARAVEVLVQPRGDSRRSMSTSALSQEGLRQPRGILCLRKLEPRAQWPAGGGSPPEPTLRSRGRFRSMSRELPEETFADLVERMREVIFTIERLPRSLIVLYPEQDILRVLLAHFHGCPEGLHPETLPLPAGPVIELRRDHTGFALREVSLPAGGSPAAAPPHGRRCFDAC